MLKIIILIFIQGIIKLQLQIQQTLKMEEESHHAQKKFQIIEQWHRQKFEQKIYKIRLYLIGNMRKAQQKLRIRYEQPYSQNPPSSNSLANKNPNNDIDEELFNQLNDQEINSVSCPNQPSFAQSLNLNQNNTKNPNNTKQIKIYQDFKNRGKFTQLKFFYSQQKQKITIIISQKFFIHQLKYRQFDLLIVCQHFTKVWQEQYLTIIQAFIKYSRQYKNHDNIKFQFVAIDIIGVTFDVAYYNKVGDKIQQLKRFRFRYSPFQFRQNPFFDQKNTEQIMSFVQVHPNNATSITQQDFYSAMRLGFIDDINNNSNDLWKRVIVRFWVFYQIHCLNRGVNDYEEFNKKILGKVHFHSIRMKKFQLIFPFQLLHRQNSEQKKQRIIYFTFYLQDKDIMTSQNGLQFKMTVNLVQHQRFLLHEQKKQLFERLRKQDAYTLIQKQVPSKSNQLFQFYMVLRFDDKIARAFAKFQTAVSFFIDKLAFLQDPIRGSSLRQLSLQQIQTERVLQIYSKPVLYNENQWAHRHQLCLYLKHKYLVQTTYSNSNSPRYMDEIQFIRLVKTKRRRNQKQKKDEQKQQISQIFINQQVRKYIAHLLKVKSLRQCYNQIIDYLISVMSVIYSPFGQSAALSLYQNRQTTLSMIISNIIKFLELMSYQSRRSQITIITQFNPYKVMKDEKGRTTYEKNPLFMREQHQHDLVAQVTFSIKDLKIYWIKRLPQGYIIVRMFEDKVQVVKDLNSKITIKINYQNIQKTSAEVLQELKNILMKQFATLQNMMV